MSALDGWVKVMELYNANKPLGHLALFLAGHGYQTAGEELRNLRPGEEDRVPVQDVEPTEVLEILRRALATAQFFLTEENRLRSGTIP